MRLATSSSRENWNVIIWVKFVESIFKHEMVVYNGAEMEERLMGFETIAVLSLLRLLSAWRYDFNLAWRHDSLRNSFSF